MKFIVCVTFLFLCTSGFSRSKAVDKSEKKGKADGHKRMLTTTQEVVDCKDDCYLNYFLGKSPPEGLDLSMFPEKRCICQKDAKGNDYFATYFDEKAGIAAYSAYIIQASDAKWIGSHKRTDVSWRTTPGINKQGSDDLYLGSSTNNIDKGHLNPSLINSYDCNHQIATFTYTNAVPQFANHNRVSWKNFEGRIANYVKHECAPKGGNMYLITGTSNYLRSTTGQQLTGKIESYSHDNLQGIVRPNSLWTAGCCVERNDGIVESIAVWGNNDENDPYTMPLSLSQLEELLRTSTFLPANLFPALQECKKRSYPHLLKLKSVIE